MFGACVLLCAAMLMNIWRLVGRPALSSLRRTLRARGSGTPLHASSGTLQRSGCDSGGRVKRRLHSGPRYVERVEADLEADLTDSDSQYLSPTSIVGTPSPRAARRTQSGNSWAVGLTARSGSRESREDYDIEDPRCTLSSIDELRAGG